MKKAKTSYDLEKATVSLREDGIIEIVIKNGSIIDIEDSIAQRDIIESFPKPRILLTDSGVETSITPEVRAYSQTESAMSIINVQAVLVYSLAQKIIVNFLVNATRRNRYGSKLKMFTDRDKAIAWLLDEKKKLTKL